MKIPWEGQKASAFGVGLSGSNSTHPCTLPKSGICVFPYLLHGAICREQVALFLVMRVLGEQETDSVPLFFWGICMPALGIL